MSRYLLLVVFFIFSLTGKMYAQHTDSLQQPQDTLVRLPVFIVNGIQYELNEQHNSFREKFGVGFKMENCVVTPFLLQHNRKLAARLDEQYGRAWRKEVPGGIAGL